MNRIWVSVLSMFWAASVFGAAEVGKPAPEFTAKDLHGKAHSLAEYKGKVVVLEAFNPNCPFVQNHYKSGAMQELQAELAQKDVVWLIVDSAPASDRKLEAAKKEWDARKIKATAWLDDSSGKIGKAYGMRTTPHMFVIGPDGKVAYEGAIDDKAAPEGDPRKARNYVREAVASLKGGTKVQVSATKPYGCGVKYAN